MLAVRYSDYRSLGIVLCLVLTACQHPQAYESRRNCTPSDVSALCVMRLAENTLAATEDHFDWASGASEMAIAYDSMGDQNRSTKLIEQAFIRVEKIGNLKQRATAYKEILTAIIELRENVNALDWFDQLRPLIDPLEPAQQAELNAQVTIGRAVHHNLATALELAIALPQGEPTEQHAKAKALRKIAAVSAKRGEFEPALRSIEHITMSIRYYQAMARLDVARLALEAGRENLAQRLIGESEKIARSQSNGYFVGAALRDIGFTYQRVGEHDLAKQYYDEALIAAGESDKQNEKARATSRIATRMSDGGETTRCSAILSTANTLTDQIDNDTLLAFSFYELTGSAAFCGDFELADEFFAKVPDIRIASTKSLRQASERDIAWGLVRDGRLEKGIARARTIQSTREQMQAYSRIVRLMFNRTMQALPRYP